MSLALYQAGDDIRSDVSTRTVTRLRVSSSDMDSQKNRARSDWLKLTLVPLPALFTASIRTALGENSPFRRLEFIQGSSVLSIFCCRRALCARATVSTRSALREALARMR